ncbi:MAG: TlpA family protein disulfide reductase [Bacteroidales bacterium]|nr:TlpA family protein disulfide reductase [Bacteroidales bacterium]MCL2739407.1 TlpA family protein disulfide reductase [Bacteroidales bacterium]
MKKTFIQLSLLLLFSAIYTTSTAQAISRNFSAYDMEGKKVSLHDFMGKVVLVDIWATWCGPCKQEIPYLKELEKDYHGQELVVMSISIDPPTDRPKWMNFVKNENLPGLQLFGGDGPRSEVARIHNINSIPRFLLYAKNGALVSANAPRPSQAELRALIDEELKK